MPCPRKRTSFIIESVPAIHLAATARGLIPLVPRPTQITIADIFRSFQQRLGTAHMKNLELNPASKMRVTLGCSPIRTVSGRSVIVSVAILML